MTTANVKQDVDELQALIAGHPVLSAAQRVLDEQLLQDRRGMIAELQQAQRARDEHLPEQKALARVDGQLAEVQATVEKLQREAATLRSAIMNSQLARRGRCETLDSELRATAPRALHDGLRRLTDLAYQNRQAAFSRPLMSDKRVALGNTFAYPTQTTLNSVQARASAIAAAFDAIEQWMVSTAWTDAEAQAKVDALIAELPPVVLETLDDVAFNPSTAR